MKKADQIVNDLKVLRIKAKKDVANNRDASVDKYMKLVGIVKGLNLAIIVASQIANRGK